MQLNGWWILDKPLGWSSAKSVAIIKRQLSADYTFKKIGHMGALDPLATGVLPIGIGNCTKQMEFMLTQPKTYVATGHFGWETDTEDLEGVITRTCDQLPTPEILQQVCSKYIGKIEQVPSTYSAININGVRAYKLAVAGRSPEMHPRTVEIYSLELNYYHHDTFGITVTCGSGTYIRALIRDIGRDCNTAAVMTYLKRTRYGDFTLAECGKLIAQS
jgi:tRNA pseudouridine55 synthase